MARGLNKVLLIGNLGKDPEMKYTQGGVPVCTFSLAVDHSRKNADGGFTDQTEWIKVVAWERLAETCNEFLRKGSKVYLEGRMQTRKYGAEGEPPKYSTEVVAHTMLMLDTKPPTGQGSQGSKADPGRYVAPGFEADYDADNDDIPF